MQWIEPSAGYQRSFLGVRCAVWASGGDQIVTGCQSADHPCGMGIYSTGHPMAECTRRLFVLDIKTPNAKPVRIIDHDAALPSYWHQ